MNKKNQIEIIARLMDPIIPLYHSSLPIVLFWNPKCGCTSLIKWFFFQIGQLEQARGYSTWIHAYREEVFEKQKHYKTIVKNELLHGKKTTYKLVRNPYKRAVSSYFAVLAVPSILEQIAPGRPEGISFKQFLYRIRAIGVKRNKINPHIAQQYSDGEEHIIDQYLKLENFSEELRAIEKKFDLKKAPLNQLSSSNHHNSQRMNLKVTNSYATRNMKPYLLKDIPSYEHFYDDETMQIVKNLYADDFKKLGYNPNIL
ncbi:sulfotransferase family 2 domain-containing protein [Fictibacillus phosphorivorans]|uniref:sulfotransferase family 2 domain-containing protein n=1 Tax=Fictibacillus phosphorivorans TaxID=1221500 RepID=UPI0011A842BA|nr:sulfotransferase family 2 domain-containing protein [Fictibacillus phosphorivorans]